MKRARTGAAAHTTHHVCWWPSQLVEVDGTGSATDDAGTSREQKLHSGAKRDPSLSVSVDGDDVVIECVAAARVLAATPHCTSRVPTTTRYANIESATLRFYKMDIELLFSTTPFQAASSSNTTFITRPNEELTVALPPTPSGEVAEHRVSLTGDLKHTNATVEVVSGALRRSAAHFATRMRVSVRKNFGHVKVQDSETGKPLSRVYVKVSAACVGARAATVARSSGAQWLTRRTARWATGVLPHECFLQDGYLLQGRPHGHPRRVRLRGPEHGPAVPNSGVRAACHVHDAWVGHRGDAAAGGCNLVIGDFSESKPTPDSRSGLRSTGSATCSMVVMNMMSRSVLAASTQAGL